MLSLSTNPTLSYETDTCPLPTGSIKYQAIAPGFSFTTVQKCTHHGRSLRYMSRVLYQAGMRVVQGMVQGMKEQVSKCTDSTIKSLRDSTCASSSSKQARLFSGAASDSGAFKANKNDKLKQAEESLRTVMYLSCWGPN